MVKPSSAVPVKYRYREWAANTTENNNIIHPIKVTNCIGAPEKEVIFRMAYLVRLHMDHLESPTVRS